MMRGAVRATIAFLATGLLLIRSAPAPDAAPAAEPAQPAVPLPVSGEGPVPSAWPSAEAAYRHGNPQMIRALLDRSRLLQDTRVEVPQDLYRQYLRETSQAPGEPSDVPFAFLAEAGTYRVSVGADLQARIKAEISIRLFDPQRVGKCPVLPAALAWENVTVNGKPVQLPSADGWLLLPGAMPFPVLGERHEDGQHALPPEGVRGWRLSTQRADTVAASALLTIAAEAPLKNAGPSGGSASLDICRTARTLVFFDSPGAWQFQSDPLFPPVVGSPDKGTHAQLALLPRGVLPIHYDPPQAHSEHASRYELRGDIAWNLEAAVEQVSAVLNVTVAGGPSDRLEMLLSDRAARVSIEGPDVREVQTSSGRATVYLRGKILGSTVLRVSYELPAGTSAQHDFGRLGVAEGHWLGGSLAVSAAGGTEVLPAASTGLGDQPLSSLPRSTAALLTGPAALAYQITARDFSLWVEELPLGQFALKQSIADLAHYEVFLDRDGSIIGRVRYEVRNREKQFLRVLLPADARILMARVNEKSCPVTAVSVGPRQRGSGNSSPSEGEVPPSGGGEGDPHPTLSLRERGETAAWLLPLERSRASVKGLVSFPVDLVYVCRGPALAAAGRGKAEVHLPAIDLPVAYGWCEAYLPQGLVAKKWTGPLSAVERFSSETATASLDYGYGELAEGYKLEDRPEYKAPPPPAPEEKKSSGSLFGWFGAKSAKPPEAKAAAPSPPPPAPAPLAEVPTPGKMPVMGKAFANAGKAQDEQTKLILIKPKIIIHRDEEERSFPGLNDENAPAATTQPSPSSQPSAYAAIQGNATIQHAAQNSSSLARNYYRVGKEYYDKGDYEKAEENLKEVQRLAPGSTEADNASRLSSNILMVQGKSGAAQGQAERAAAREVQKEVSQQNREQVLRQDTLLAEGREALRAGRQDEARSKLQVAQALGQEVLAQDPGNLEVRARTEQSGDELGNLGKLASAQTAGLRQRLEQFKQQRQFDQALDVARKIRQAEGDNRQIQDEMQQLAVAAAEDKALRLTIQAKQRQLAELDKKGISTYGVSNGAGRNAIEFTGAAVLSSGANTFSGGTDQSRNHASGEMINMLYADGHVGDSQGRADTGVGGGNIYSGGTSAAAGHEARDPRQELAELNDRLATAESSPKPIFVSGKLPLNFQDAPVRNVLQYLGETGGFTIVETAPVEGRVTIISRQPVTVDEELALVDTVLREKGYALVRNGRVLRVVSIEVAKHETVPVRTGGDPNQIGTTDRVVTQIIPIKTKDAGKLKGDLASVTPASVDVTTNAVGDALVVTGPEASIRRLAEIVRALDVQSAPEAPVDIFHLKYASATAAAKLVTDMFKEGGSPGRRGGRPGATVTATGEDRTNTLVVSASEDMMETIRNVIDEIDKNPLPSLSVMMYPLKNADAKDAAERLSRLVSQDTRQAGGEIAPPSLSGSFVADTDTNSLLVTATPEQYERIKELIAKLDAEAPAGRLKATDAGALTLTTGAWDEPATTRPQGGGGRGGMGLGGIGQAAGGGAGVKGDISGDGDLDVGVVRDDILDVMDRQRPVQKQKAEFDMNEAFKRANSLLAKANTAAEFDASSAAVSVGENVMTASKGLYSIDELRQRQGQVDQLRDFIRTKRAVWERGAAQKQRNEIEKSEVSRLSGAQDEIRRQVFRYQGDVQAAIHQKDYTRALDLMDRILKIDPENQPVREQKYILQQVELLQREKEAASEDYSQRQQQIVTGVREAEIPWNELLRYPKDWRETTVKREPYASATGGESEQTRQALAKLKRKVPQVGIDNTEFKDVVEWLQAVANFSIQVKWSVLETAGITPATIVKSVHLADVSVEKALRTVLDDVGGTAPLGYVIDEGVLIISTKDDLAGPRYRKTMVYDISDLLVTVPDFAGPRMSLNMGGGNANAASAAGTGGIFGGATAGGANANVVNRAEIVNQLTRLISRTIDRDSWMDPYGTGTVGSVSEMNGQLVITQTEENQRAVADLIRQLRQTRALGTQQQEAFIQGPSRPRADTRLTVAYDIRDLLATTPQSQADEKPTISGRPPAPKTRQDMLNEITGLVKQSVAADSWGDYGAGAAAPISEQNGQLVVTQTSDNQRAIATLLSNLREAKGPQVELGGNIAGQRAYGVITGDGARVNVNTATADQLVALGGQDKELNEFIRRNYDWAYQNGGQVQLPGVTIQDLQTTASVPEGGTLLLGGQAATGQIASGLLEKEEGSPLLSDIPVIRRLAEGQRQRAQGGPRLTISNGQQAYVTFGTGQAYVANVTPVISENVVAYQTTVNAADQSGSLVSKLQANLGQKVVVNSMNLSGDAQTAAGLGVNWKQGNNGVTYAVVDEAVLRSLQEMDAQAQRQGRFVNANGRTQETIVGTDALLANGMVGNLAFAGERANSLDVYDNSLELPHEKVLLVANDGYLTAVKAGAMQHWTQRAAPVTFGEVPQTIEPPRVGRLVKFEKRLLEPSDRMVIGIEYTMEGESK